MILGGHDTHLKAKAAYEIAAGRVTAARIPAAADEPPLRTGKSYAVQSRRTSGAICRVTAHAVQRTTVGDLTFDQARALGFPNVAAAQLAWREHTDRGRINPSEPVWLITFTLDRQTAPRFLAAYSPLGYTSDPHRALPEEPEVIDDHDLDRFTQAARERMPVGEPRAKPPAEPGLVDRVEQALRDELAQRFRGERPEDIAEQSPKQGTPGDIRRRRREMGVRAVDGLFPVPADQVDELVASMAEEGCSVRDVALALDCSTGKAHKLLAPHRPQEAKAA